MHNAWALVIPAAMLGFACGVIACWVAVASAVRAMEKEIHAKDAELIRARLGEWIWGLDEDVENGPHRAGEAN